MQPLSSWQRLAKAVGDCYFTVKQPTELVCCLRRSCRSDQGADHKWLK